MRIPVSAAVLFALSACVPVPHDDGNKNPKEGTVVVARGVTKTCDGDRAIYRTTDSARIWVIENAAECAQ